jgi:glyoxylase-like metal-dependent hydrolase (beta-lactamase superfamily II)
MYKKFLAAAALATLAIVWVVSAQSDAQTAINNSLKAMGMENVNTLTISGEGGDGFVGQQLNPHSDYWRWYKNKNFVRGYDFQAKGFRTQRLRGEGNIPPGGGAGTATPAPVQTQNVVTMANAFNAQMEMAMTPVGFLKAASANNATVSMKTEQGKRYTVLSYPAEVAGAAPYKTTVSGSINADGLVEKVETVVHNDFFGDMKWEALFTGYKDFGGGLKFPSQIVQRQGGPKLFELAVSDVKVNQPVDLTQQAKGGPGGGKGGPGGGKAGDGKGGDLKGLPPLAEGKGAPPDAKGKGGPPGGGRGGPGAAPLEPEDLGGGFWLSRSGYGAIIADFRDYIIIVEGGQNYARGETLIAEAKRLIPNKPIRYVINTHTHSDHAGGLRAFVAEGVTIVTHEGNKGYYERVLANPHTLVPDKLQQMASKPRIRVEYVGDKRVFTDGTHIIETHHLKGSTHNQFMLIVYLPKQKILLEADEFNVPGQVATQPPATVNAYQANLLARIEELKLDVERIIPVHLPGDNRKVAFSELLMAAGWP